VTSSDQTITCTVHGSAEPAYVCNHLLDDPVQFWFSELPTVENKCPDAWCSSCEAQFQELGEWTDENTSADNIKVICQHCYENNRMQSIPYCMAAVAESWDKYVSHCVERLNQKQELLQTQFKINEHKRWDWDQGTGALVFSNDDVQAVISQIQFVGSISTSSDTWLWAWANSSLEPESWAKVLTVQKYGETSNFVNLTTPLWVADEIDGWEMTAVAVELLDAKGAYRTPSSNGFTYLALTDVAWIS